MSSSEPSQADNILEYLANYRCQRTDQFHNYELYVLACSPNGEDDGDDRMLLVKADPTSDSSSTTTWRVPQLDLANRPGSTGFQDNLNWTAFTFARDLFTARKGDGILLPFFPLWCVTRLIGSSDEASGVRSERSRTLQIYLMVGYDHPQRLTIDPKGDDYGLISMAWLREHRDAFAGSQCDFNLLTSFVRSFHASRNTPSRDPRIGGPRTYLPSLPRRQNHEDEGYVSALE